MPTYEFKCPSGHKFDRYLPVSDYQTPQTCECGLTARRIISLPMLVICRPDVCYDSPIDGKPITSAQARKEDLARSGCIEYDPEMKKDQQRRIEREDAVLEAAVSETVDAEIARMPARKREKLESEMQGGMDLQPERVTPDLKPIKTEIHHG